METNRPYSSVSEPRWPNDVYLVGGGPSLKGFDLRRLDGRTVVAINDSMLYLPNATAVISADRTWVDNRRAELNSFQGEKYIVPPEGDPRDIKGVIYLRRSRDTGLSESDSVIHVRGSSGYAALNLAFLKKARRIFLLGFDFCRSAEHWHAGYAWESARNDNIYAGWAREFDSAVPQLQRVGMKVINACPYSAISAFPKISLEAI